MTYQDDKETIKEHRRKYEPVRSRMAIDLSKDARNTVADYARHAGMNPKQLILSSLAAQHPILAELLLAEIRTTNHYTLKDTEKA